MKASAPALLLILLSACASPRLVSTPELAVVSSGEMPAPNRQDLLAANRPYLIGPFDKLRIDVFGVEDLHREVQIDASGRLSFPLIGVIEVSGRTPAELATEIEQRLAGRFVRNPQVTVNLTETVSQVITVEGQVAEPGLYPVIGNMTLVRAVATAGGVAEFASLNDVVVFRTVDGQRYAALYNLKAIRRGTYADPELFANDVVIVGDSQARRIFRDVLQAAPLLTTPIVVLSRN